MEEELCAVCSVPCTQRCGKCKNVSYCSKEHQSSHWREHKKECHPFKIVTLPDKGRVLIATKDMPPYSIIIKEHSIINLPNDNEDKKLFGKICVSCCKVSENLKSCSKCSAPVCGRDCEMAEIHANYECQVFPSGNKYRELTRQSKLMAVIRCLLLKSRDREKYDVLMALQSNIEHVYADKNALERYITNAAVVELILKEVGLHEYESEESALVTGIIDTNSLTSTMGMLYDTVDRVDNKRSSMHLYAMTSIASHSCVPNVRPIIQNSGRVKLIATRPILAGEEITIAYIGLNQGTVERRKKLWSYYYFSCKCTRCQDPTEFGTNFSSIKCRQCPDGYLVPKYSKQDSEAEVIWMCNHCSQTITEARYHEVLCSLDNQILEIMPRFALKMETVTEQEVLIAKYSGNILHPNHYLLFTLEDGLTEVMSSMINLKEQSKINLSPQDIKYLKETLVAKCRKLLTICDKLFPGANKIRGEKLYMLWYGMQDDTYHQKMAAFISRPQEQRHVFPDFIKEHMAVAEEAVQILSLELDGTLFQDIVNELNEWISTVK